jgi:HAD superfamily hydrolase (TIGR01509 family)
LITAVLFDIDGTLVDSNDAHAAAWVRAFSEFEIAVDPDLVRRCIGMGGDKLLPTVIGITESSPMGAQISERRGEIFKAEFLPRLKPFPGADRLVAAVRDRGLTAVAASSASKDDLRSLLKVAGVESLMDSATSSDDAEESKPDPDIIVAALARAKARPDEAIMIGDTPYDVEAAQRAGVRVIGFRCGGWGDEDLKGAAAIYQGPLDLVLRLNSSPIVAT